METIDRAQLLLARFQRHDLHRAPGELASCTELPLLDQGVQDTGGDGAPWALAVRGAPPALEDELVYAWTLRGAPHAYRRTDATGVAVATAPWSEVDAGKRVFDAAKPLRAAGIPVLDALRTVAKHARAIVERPTVKGELSRRLTEVLEDPYLRWCRPCQATHAYEQTFRLAALQAGLELEPGTSPPVLRRIPRLRPNLLLRLGDEAPAHLDVVRGHLRFYPGAGPKDVAAFVDVPVKEVAARWPADAIEVVIAGAPEGATGWVLAEDLDELRRAEATRAVRLVGPYDPYLQARDRTLLVGDPARAKALWPVLGRPGAIVADGEVVGTWRPRTSGKRFTLLVEPWGALSRWASAAVEVEAERLATHRGVALAAVSYP
ncbi:MAG: DNA glycosylase AlkZ-like family protein [Actinomycetota bacterium]